MIGIICAMEIEARKLLSEMNYVSERTISGVKFSSGKIKNTEAVVAVCGVGKVYAALCTEAMILNYAPESILNVGIAGTLSDEYNLFDTVVAETVVQHDMDTTAIGDPAGYLSGIGTEIRADIGLNNSISAIGLTKGVTIKKSRVASGDRFIGTAEDRKKLREKFSAGICEMEGGAIAQVCYVNGVKFALIRTISDAECEDFAAFAEKAADTVADIIAEYLKSI